MDEQVNDDLSVFLPWNTTDVLRCDADPKDGCQSTEYLENKSMEWVRAPFL